MGLPLWSRPQDVQAWQAALDGYAAARDSSKPKLRDLERWYVEDLPSLIASRKREPYMTKEELIKLVEWKLARGKFRPGLLLAAQQQEESLVIATSQTVFKVLQGVEAPGDGSLEQIRTALTQLTKLKGVGPATASALMAAVCSHAPFMSDEALKVVCKKGSLQYTPKAYLALVQALQARAAELNEAGGGDLWTAVLVERALWSESQTPRTDLPPRAGEPEAEVGVVVKGKLAGKRGQAAAQGQGSSSKVRKT